MYSVAKGKYFSPCGWTYQGRAKLPNYSAPPKTYPGFISPEDKRVTITNLQAFCKEHGMLNLVSGECKSNYKGWLYVTDSDKNKEGTQQNG